jgi:hypothetical protein
MARANLTTESVSFFDGKTHARARARHVHASTKLRGERGRGCTTVSITTRAILPDYASAFADLSIRTGVYQTRWRGAAAQHNSIA